MNEQHEVSAPQALLDPELTTTVRMLERRRASAPGHVAFRVGQVDDSGVPASLREVTTEEFAAQAEAAAAQLLAWGVQPGERVLIMARTSYEWAVADFACGYAAAVVVPLYPGSPAARLKEAIDTVGASLVLTEPGDPAVEAGLPAGIRHATLPDLAAVPSATAEQRAELRKRWEAVESHEPATIVMTSGTTGDPRPVLITHANLTGVAESIRQDYSRFLHDRASTVILLPLAHVLARGLQLVCVHAGMAITHLDDPSRVLPTLKLAQPTFLVVVPRVLDKVRERMRALAAKAGLGRIMESCESLAISRAKSQQQQARTGSQDTPPATWRQRVATGLADRTVFALMRKLFGGRVEVLLSGAAALPVELGLFMQGAGLPVIQGYGLTETTAPATGQRWGDLRAGTVGTPVPGTTIRIAADGEILVKGPGVCAGYGIDLARAVPATDEDGFFATGDLGHLEDGHLIVTGRKKELITTSYGKTISPAKWQAGMEDLPEVEHALMVGENRPFLLGILLVHDGGGQALTPVGTVGRAVQDRDAALAASVPRAESVRSLLVLRGGIDDDPQLVTPTGKLRTGALAQKLSEVIDAEYARLEAAR